MIYHYKKSIIYGIRAAIISFVFLLMFNLIVYNDDKVMNFIFIIIITFISSFMIGTSIFINSYAKTMKHLKQVSIIIFLLTLVIFSYMEYPFYVHTIEHRDKYTGEMKITIGNIKYIEPVQGDPNNVQISIG